MRYFFSFMVTTLTEDHVGKILASDAAALKQAEDMAIDCAGQGILDGCSIVVSRDGKVLFDVPVNQVKH